MKRSNNHIWTTTPHRAAQWYRAARLRMAASDIRISAGSYIHQDPTGSFALVFSYDTCGPATFNAARWSLNARFDHAWPIAWAEQLRTA